MGERGEVGLMVGLVVCEEYWVAPCSLLVSEARSGGGCGASVGGDCDSGSLSA